MRKRLASIALLLLWTAGLGPAPAGAATPPELLALHQEYVRRAHPLMERATLSGRSDQYYFTSIQLMGMLSAIEAALVINPPAAQAAMRQAVHYMDNMVSKAVLNQGRRVWAQGASVNELYNLQGAQPIARAAMLIRRTPALREAFAARADAYVAFVEDCIIRRWYIDTYRRNPPWLVGDPPEWGDGRKFNDKSWLLGDIAHSLHQATGQRMYLDLLNRISAGFRGFLKPLRTGWVWNNGTIPIGSDKNGEPGSVGNQAGAPDTAHANRVPVMMAFQLETGQGGWTPQDLQRLANTVGDTLWNQSLSDPLVANYVNGSNAAYRQRREPGSNGFIFSGWALMGAYSDKAQQLAEAMLAALERTPQNATVRANANELGDQYYKPVALSGHVLRNRVVGKPLAPSQDAGLALGARETPRAYPNPWRSDEHEGHDLTFDRMPTEATVEIFSVAGQFVKRLGPAAELPWDLTNDAGDPVASGLYLYLITTPEGKLASGKLAVIR